MIKIVSLFHFFFKIFGANEEIKQKIDYKIYYKMPSECFGKSENLEYQIYTYDGFLNKPLGKH